ncbi:SAM-dependent methyltransferase [Legionella sp. km772]|uniref:SAM-dependent methyltransferase n=1 Tax=Legionella sp. km772 TaxID=2498111 RepID=UPI000F8CE9E6|nr:SAM-dependent methyltransferase [Legionella sp. km772]RUR12936.1 SAM-dependent methyltransferase [Legionella sp. km772]
MIEEKQPTAVYVVKPEFVEELKEELGETEQIIEDLVFSSHKTAEACFAQDVWLEPQIVAFKSISEAVKILKSAGKFWYLHPISHIRRSKLIEQELRQYKALISTFPLQTEIPNIGVFSLLDNNRMIFSHKRLKKWPDGRCFFTEDKENPPNRAYLKLWEALTLLNKYPKKGDLALDLGASPGGWTYVMQSLGAQVTAIDKAPLAPRIANLPGVHFLQQSAFALEPEQCTITYDWVLSDVACYPERAYNLIMKWIKSEKVKQLIFTIKLQGKTDLKIIKELQEIPNSYICNLFHNKHEATFFYPFKFVE